MVEMLTIQFQLSSSICIFEQYKNLSIRHIDKLIKKGSGSSSISSTFYLQIGISVSLNDLKSLITYSEENKLLPKSLKLLLLLKLFKRIETFCLLVCLIPLLLCSFILKENWIEFLIDFLTSSALSSYNYFKD